jgi:hypothetical protein
MNRIGRRERVAAKVWPRTRTGRHTPTFRGVDIRDAKRWWDRLKAALGTTSSDFVNATLAQIQNASRLPTGGICEMSVNAVLAFIEAAEPKNEMEAASAVQMACTHAVAMAVLSRAGGAYGGTRHVAIMAAASA